MDERMKQAVLRMLYEIGWKRMLETLAEVAHECARLEQDHGEHALATQWVVCANRLEGMAQSAGKREWRPQDN